MCKASRVEKASGLRSSEFGRNRARGKLLSNVLACGRWSFLYGDVL